MGAYGRSACGRWHYLGNSRAENQRLETTCAPGHTLARRDGRMATHQNAPVDAGSYPLHRLAGLNVPTTTPSSSTHTYQPAASVPFSSEFFNNLLGDAGDLSAEAWRRLRR